MGDAVTPALPDFTTQTATQYKTNIDASIAAADRLAWSFAPHEAAVPDMTVQLNSGFIWDGSSLTEKSAQTTGIITAPTTNPRIDRVVVDASTGVVSVITGTEAASPTPPAIPVGKLPVAQVLLSVGQSQITNADITDERAFFTNPQFLNGGLVLGGATGGDQGVGTVNATEYYKNGSVLSFTSSLEFIASATANNSSSIDFTNLSSTYFAYLAVMEAVVPATDGTAFLFRVSNDNGATFIAGTGYEYAELSGAPVTGIDGGWVTGTSSIIMSHNALGNAALESYSGVVHIINPMNSLVPTRIVGEAMYRNSSGNMETVRFGGTRLAAEANDAIRFVMGSGNISSGTIKLYGMRAA